MSEFYISFAAQDNSGLNMDAWCPSADDLQMVLDDMEKAGHKGTKPYLNLQQFLKYTLAKSRCSGRLPRITIK